MSDVSPMIGGCVLKAKRPRIHTQSQTSTGMHTCSKSSSSLRENATIRKSKVIRVLLCELRGEISAGRQSNSDNAAAIRQASFTSTQRYTL